MFHSLKMNLGIPSSLNSFIFFSSFGLYLLILAFIELESAIWTGLSSHFILKYCERWYSSYKIIVAISLYLGTLLITSFWSDDITCTSWLNTVCGDQRKGQTSKTVGILKERKKYFSYKVKWFNSYSKIDPSKTLVVGKTNFIRVGMFESEVDDKFRSWYFGCCVVWFYFKDL